MPIDKVTLQILADHCRAAAESMAYTVYRTAHSTFVKETEDFTTGITTPDGLTFASPKELGATWFTGLNYRNVIEMIPSYEEGDICMTNDPYSGYVCTHPPDIHLWKPIFHKGEIVAFSVGHIHNTDIGGAVPASLSRTLTEVHQEGIRFPPVKLARKGVIDEQLLKVMYTNVRVPEQNWGDLKAQIAGMNTGEQRVHEIIAKFGVDTFRQGVKDMLDYAEAQARAIVRGIPDGEYFFADYLDEDAAGGKPCRIALNLIVKGDSLVMDFTGSDPQLLSSINIPTGGQPDHMLMMVGLVYVLYSLDPTLLLNAGVTRVARCILPEGTIVNPKFPAAVGMRSISCVRLQGVIFGAFSRAVPERMPAAPSSGGPIMNVRTIDNRTGRIVMASIDPITGGAGGSAHGDGADGSGANSAFLKNTPVEINENEVPIKILRYGLKPDSGGAGKFRGGCATTLEFKVFAPNTGITARNRDRSRFNPFGVLGGKAGAVSTFTLNPGKPNAVDLANTDIFTAGPGDIVLITASGGGGWGHPIDRPAEAVLKDVRCGFVSKAVAEADYGVILKGDAVDEKATEARRAQMRRSLSNAHFAYGPERMAFEKVWTEANYAVLTEILAGVAVHWRFWVKHKIFDALEALPEEKRTGKGREVRDAFAALQAEFPQLRAQPMAAE